MEIERTRLKKPCKLMLTKEIKPEDLVIDEIYKIETLQGMIYIFTYLGEGKIILEDGHMCLLEHFLVEDDVILTIPLPELFINLNFN